MVDERLRQSILLELERVLATPGFSGAARSAALLLFLVNETLDGRGDQLKEYVLGVNGLGRPETFDPRVDPIARVEASRLRNKLDLCYAASSPATNVRIVLPRGTYVPEFRVQEQQVAPRSQLPPIRKLGLSIAVVCAALLLSIGFSLVWRSPSLPARKLQLSVLPPQDLLVQAVAVSPDGSWLAIAASSHGTAHLYLRSLSDSFDFMVLPTTEGAAYPFWSPDSRSIGFFASAKLKVIEVSGGEPRVLANAPLGRGGAWTKDGQIIFAPGALGALLHIPSNGGRAEPFSTLDSTRGEVSHLWPVLLPDGHRVAYLVKNSDPALNEIVSADLERHDKLIDILKVNSSAGFVRSEHDRVNILFLREGALVQQPLDRTTLQPVGEPKTIAPQIDFEPLSRYAFFSSGADLLAFVPGTPFRYQLAWVDRNGGEIASLQESGEYYPMKLSRNGEQLLTQQTDPRTGSTSVVKTDLVRTTTSRVTSGSVDFFPIWSPDGSEIAFARSDGTAERGMRLSVMNANGGPPRVLLDIKGPAFPTDWSADGRYIAYTGFSPIPEVRVISADGSNPTPVWNSSAKHHSVGGAVFSPASNRGVPQWLAYSSDESGRNEVYVQSFLEAQTKLQISAAGGTGPVWRPDGKELYFLNAEEDVMALDVPVGNQPRFGSPHRLFHMPTPAATAPPYGASFAVSRDGGRFLVRRPSHVTYPVTISVMSQRQ
jgi:Tol biopolymer transport system component